MTREPSAGRRGDRALWPRTQAHIDLAKHGMNNWKPFDFQQHNAEVGSIEADNADAMTANRSADSPTIQAIARRMRDWAGRAWSRSPTKAAFIVLGGFYQDHPDSRARYGGRAAGLADYMTEAMRAFAETRLI
jgi:MerR family transcriptional regulator, thiopeptide resistance regulator